jgi:hypothetical protein
MNQIETPAYQLSSSSYKARRLFCDRYESSYLKIFHPAAVASKLRLRSKKLDNSKCVVLKKILL